MQSKEDQPSTDEKPANDIDSRTTGFGKPYEDHLLDDIKALISEAYSQSDPNSREQLLTDAQQLEIQLVMSYEKQGYNLLAVNTQKRIREYERELRDCEPSSKYAPI